MEFERKFTNHQFPFEKYKFCLDPKNPDSLNRTLSEKITKLGGTIDFISKDTPYLITCRPKSEWPRASKDATNTKQTAKALPMPGVVLSRAEMFLMKATEQKTFESLAVTDTLILAQQLKIAILRSDRVLEFCNKRLKELSEEKNNDPKLGTSTPGTPIKYLHPPFIKVVDNSFRYRTTYKQLTEWPQINFEYQPELCPFFKKQPKPPTATAIPASNESTNTNKSTVPTAQRQLNEKCTRLTTPILGITNGTTPSNANTNTNRSMAPNIANQMKNHQRKRHNMTYCEICHKDYIDFEKHLNDPKHSEFLANDENFREVQGVIRSLRSFIKKDTVPIETAKQDTVEFNDLTNIHRFKGQESEEAMMVNHQRQQTPTMERPVAKATGQKVFMNTPSPSMPLCSINAWSSASKNRSFVALHDLIGGDQNDTDMVAPHSDPPREPKIPKQSQDQSF